MTKSRTRLFSWTLGGVAALGLAAFPLTMRSAQAIEANSHNPHIHHALDALHEAHDEISNAPHNFHGKRKEALEVLDHAIERLDEIKDYDN